MKVPKGVRVYIGRKCWKAGQDVPKRFDDLCVDAVSAVKIPVKPEKKQEKKSDELAGEGRK